MTSRSSAILPRKPAWWAALGLILLLAGGLYLTGYNFSLPYIDHPDEPAFNLAARMILDQGSARPMSFHAYPPGIISVNYFFVKFFQPEGTPPASVLPLVRLMAIVFGIGAVALVALLAWQAAGEIAGLLAALLWAILPLIVANSRFATPNNFVTFFALLALFGALTAARSGRQSWGTGGLYALMLAIVFKTQAIFLLPLVLALPLWRLRYLSERAATLRALGWNLLRIALFLFWLLVFYPTLEADTIPYWVAPSETLALPAPELLWNNLRGVLLALMPLEGWLAHLALLGLLALPHVRARADLLVWACLIVAGAAWLYGVSLFGAQPVRQFYALAALLTILRAGLLVLVIYALSDLIGRRLPQERARLAAAALLAVPLGVGLWPSLNASLANAQDAARPDRRVDLMRYFDSSLEPGPYISIDEFAKVFNREWGGYDGRYDFPLLEKAIFTARSVEEWRAMGATYAILADSDWRENAALRALEPELLVLKRYPDDMAYRDPGIVVVRLTPIETQTEGQLGSIHLLGYDLDRSVLRPGESFSVRYYWRAQNATDAPYRIFNHLTQPGNVEIVAQADGPPLFAEPEQRPTSLWNDPREVLVSRRFVINLPDNLAPGTYTLRTGFYRPDTGARLQNPRGGDALVTLEIIVTNGE